jgi:peptide/nickel transport system permease protein
MTNYIIRRLILIIPVLFLVSIVIFFAVQVIPGSAIEQTIAKFEYHYQESDIEAIKAAMGLGSPLHVQYIHWIGGMLRGDLGKSLWTGQPVLPEIMIRLPVSIELGILAIVIGLIIALPIGIYSATRQDTWGDYIGRSLAISGLALPDFWVATLIMVFPAIWWHWAPSLSYIPFIKDPLGNLVQFVIPACVLGMYLSGATMRMMRTMMLEVLRQDYIRTAWAKGLTERMVIIRHALKNALIPVITLIGLQIPILIGGTVIIENIFGLPGMGRYFLNAVQNRDYIVIGDITMIICVFVLLVNLVVDLTYSYLDPRLHYE